MFPDQVDTNSLNDAVLWQQLRAGERQALAALYERYGRSLLTYACRLTKDEDLAQDCVQELYVDLWNQRQSLTSDIQNARFYLLGAIRHKALRYMKRLERQESWQPSHEFDEAELPYETWLVETEHETDQIAQLRRAISKLAPRQQEIIHLRFFQKFTHNEAAMLLDLQPQSARNLLHTALLRLREHLRVSLQILFIFMSGLILLNFL